MSGVLFIRNRQQTVRVNTRQLRRIALALLEALQQTSSDKNQPAPRSSRRKEAPIEIRNQSEHPHVGCCELGVYIVDAAEMTRLNETFLRHAGSTDVIAFDYSDHAPRFTHHVSRLHGEIFLCLDEARIQARRFRTTWQSELVRYLVHGLLHLLGHDDRRAADRRKMKREENRLLRQLERDFAFRRLGRR